MTRRSWFASLFVIAGLLVSSSLAMADGTGGATHATEDAWAKQNPTVAAEQRTASEAKLQAVTAKLHASTGAGVMTTGDYPPSYRLNSPQIGQGIVKNWDPFYTSPPLYNAYIRNVGPGAGSTEPCLNPDQNNRCRQPPRFCVHCGTDATLIALRYMKSAGMALSPDDLSAFSDGQAMFKLGDGYLNGNNASYAIQTCCDDSPWNISPFYNLHYQIKANLNARQTINDYYQETSFPISAASLQTMVTYDVGTLHVPTIAGVQTGALPYYSVGTVTSNLGHVIVIDGYSTLSSTYTVNDPNDCSRYASQWGLLGHHTVSAASLLAAINQSSSSVEW